MTFDFIDDLQEWAEKEGIAFMVIVQEPIGEQVSARFGLDNWDCANSGLTLKEDVLQATEACLDRWGEENEQT